VTKPGEDDPAASLEVVILKANPHLSKLFYANGYEEGAAEKPTCYSNDGVAPAADAQEKQATKCAICPHNQWGSRVTENGSRGKACTDLRRLAVAPIGELELPMLLRVPAGTLRDLANYADLLNRRKAPYQAVVTKIAFDHTVAHQKLTFKANRWLSEEEAEIVARTLEKDVINQIVGAGAPVDEVAELPDKSGVDALGAPPAHVAKAAAPAKAAPAKAAPAKAAVKPRVAKAQAELEAEVTKAVASVKTVVEPEPVAAKARPAFDASALLAEADASLDDALSALDD
jgi:hypothetical protein